MTFSDRKTSSLSSHILKPLLPTRLPFHHAAERHQGSVLLAVLCLVTVLASLVVTSMTMAKWHGDRQSTHQGRLRASELAEMGVALAVHPLIKPGDPQLRRKVSSIESFEVVVSTEEGRLNLNSLLTKEHLPVLARIFNSWGISPGDAQGIAMTLLDWTDADDVKGRPDSAEKADYQRTGFSERPFNRKFTSMDEVDLVARATEIYAARPDWRSFFTLRGNGQVDVNSATAEVISMLAGVSMESAMQLVNKRNGPDGLPHTQDDLPLQTLDEALALLGLAGQQAESITPLLTLQGTLLRVESVGKAGDDQHGIVVVVESPGTTPRIAEWREYRLKGGQRL